MFALRFEDDICEGKREVADSKLFAKGELVGLFATAGPGAGLECLVYGPVTKIRSSSVLGGPGSWVEIHGEDRRLVMGRTGVNATYVGKASSAAEAILRAYDFKPDTQPTLIEHDTKKKQLTQSGTDLAFLEDIARRNNMEFWIEYEVTAAGAVTKLTEKARLRTSPDRSQTTGLPQLPTLKPGGSHAIRVNPPAGICPNITKFDARIDFEKPTSVEGFMLSDKGDKKVVEDIVKDATPLDPAKPVAIKDVKRELAEPTVLAEEAFLAKEATVFERSWFVEIDCSATVEQLGFLVRPHQILEVANAGSALSGGYQVMKAVHVMTATDHFMDFTLRANGLGGVS